MSTFFADPARVLKIRQGLFILRHSSDRSIVGSDLSVQHKEKRGYARRQLLTSCIRLGGN